MIVRIEGGKIERISHQVRRRQFRQWCRGVTPIDFQSIVSTLNQDINRVGNGEIFTTSWIPGRDWTGTPYEPLFNAVGDRTLAGFFFGLIVWHVILNRPETWSFGRYPKRSGDIIGMTYFQV